MVRVDCNHDEGADDGHPHHDEIARGVGVGQLAEHAWHEVEDKAAERISDLEMADGLEHLFGGTELERPKRDTGGAERHADAEHDCCCGCFGHATYSNKRAEQHGYREQDEETERPGERAELVTDDAYDEFRYGQENACERDEQRRYARIDPLGREQDAEVVVACDGNAAEQHEREDHRHIRSAWQRHRSKIHPWTTKRSFVVKMVGVMGMVRLVDMAVLVLFKRWVVRGLFVGRRAGCCALFVGFFDRSFSDLFLGVLCRQVFWRLIRLRARYDRLESDVFGLHAYELEQQQREDEGDRCFNIECERKGERIDQPTCQDRDEDSSHAASHRSDARDRTHFATKPVADQIGGCHHTAKTVPDARKRAGHA